MKKSIQELGKEMVLFGTYEDYDVEDIVKVLKEADNIYFNMDEDSFLADKDYDNLKLYASRVDPINSYFTGVGSEVRGSKVKLPYPMGSLDQIEVGDMQAWLDKWNLESETFIITDKLDGISALLIYGEDAKLKIAYSRGDGLEGQDITRHLWSIPSVQWRANSNTAIRGEIIIRKENWEKIKELVKTKAGKPYKNPRNCIAGLMNAEKNNPDVYQYIDFVAYNIVNYLTAKNIELLLLEKHLNFKVPRYEWVSSKMMYEEKLSEYLMHRRDNSPYEIDGIVIDVNDEDTRKRMKPTRDTLNPAHTVKYKVTSLDNIKDARVSEVWLNVSKHGYIKPTIEIDPIDIEGVTITHCTGFNMKYIKDNKIGPGAIIKVTRAGSVIPFCMSIVEPMPISNYDEWLVKKITGQVGDWQWNDTNVDAVVLTPEQNQEVAIQQAINFFSAIDIPNLKEGTIRTMFELHIYKDGTNAILSMLHYKLNHWVSCIGANGEKIYNGIIDKLDKIPFPLLLGVSPCFGRGVGVRKFKKLLTAIKIDSILGLRTLSFEDIVEVDGFEEITAFKILNGIEPFVDFVSQMNFCSIDFSVGSEGHLKGKKFCFTGFRSKELQRLIEEAGGEVSSGVSSKTAYVVAKDPQRNTGKVKKANELDIPVIGIQELEELVQ